MNIFKLTNIIVFVLTGTVSQCQVNSAEFDPVSVFYSYCHEGLSACKEDHLFLREKVYEDNIVFLLQRNFIDSLDIFQKGESIFSYRSEHYSNQKLEIIFSVDRTQQKDNIEISLVLNEKKSLTSLKIPIFYRKVVIMPRLNEPSIRKGNLRIKKEMFIVNCSNHYSFEY